MVFTYKDYTLVYGESPDAVFLYTDVNNIPLYENTGTLTKDGKLIGNYRGDISTFQKLEKTLRAKNNPPAPAPCSKRPPFTFNAVVTSYEKFLSLFPVNSVFMYDYSFNGRKYNRRTKLYDVVTKCLTAEIYDLESHVNTFITKYGYYGFKYETAVFVGETVVYIK